MTTNQLAKLLKQMDRRLAAIEGQAKETREQAQHTLDRIGLLRRNFDQILREVLATTDTSDHIPISGGNAE